jgi:hypothetical protein
MKCNPWLPVFGVLAVLVSPVILHPVAADGAEHQAELRYAIMGEMEGITGIEHLSTGETETVIRVLQQVNQELCRLRRASTIEEVELVKASILSEMANINGLKIFQYLLDRLEDIIDGYLTPWTRISIGSHIFSYGHGKAFIPLDIDLPMGITHQTFVGLLLRPVWWDYNLFSYTMVRKGKVFPPRIDFMDTIGRQQGFMVGFVGLYLRILRPALPDTHLFIGRTLLLVNKDLFL